MISFATNKTTFYRTMDILRPNIPFDKPISYKQFNFALETGLIIDGRAGGLVIGKSHDEGGIYLIEEAGDGFQICAEIEGGEFLVSKEATKVNGDKLEEINKATSHKESITYQITPKTRIIYAAAIPHDRIIWIEGPQFVVNKVATALYCDEINTLNERDNPRIVCNLEHLWLISDEELEEE